MSSLIVQCSFMYSQLTLLINREGVTVICPLSDLDFRECSHNRALVYNVLLLSWGLLRIDCMDEHILLNGLFEGLVCLDVHVHCIDTGMHKFSHFLAHALGELQNYTKKMKCWIFKDI